MQFKRRLAPISVLNLVPMVDIVFQLVIFFMVTSTFIMTPAIRLTLPQSTTAVPTPISRLVVTVAGSDAIYVNRERYNLAGLDRALAAMTAEQRKGVESVIVEGDASVSYDLMIQVLDVLRHNDFTGISLRLRTPPAASSTGAAAAGASAAGASGSGSGSTAPASPTSSGTGGS